MEAFYIAAIKLELNRQGKSFELRLFPKGIKNHLNVQNKQVKALEF